MKELIKINQEVIGAKTVNSVNARDLYKTLEIKKDFSDWINHQINSLGLEENIDYIIFKENGKGRGRSKKQYIITTDTAKHISMASRTTKGKDVRNYFIEVEKEFKKLQTTIYKGKNIEHIINGYKSQLSQKNKQIKALELKAEKNLTLGVQTNEEFYQGIKSENVKLKQLLEGVIHLKEENKKLKKLQSENRLLKEKFVKFKDRYHKIVLKTDNPIEIIKSELKKMTNIFQSLSSLTQEGKNLNQDTESKHIYWFS